MVVIDEKDVPPLVWPVTANTLKPKIVTEKVCAGFYKYSLGEYVVEVTSREPNPAYGDTKTMWVAVAMWSSNTYTDPLDSKAYAVECAKEMLMEKAKREGIV